jgi:hypothetical protein
MNDLQNIKNHLIPDTPSHGTLQQFSLEVVRIEAEHW